MYKVDHAYFPIAERARAQKTREERTKTHSFLCHFYPVFVIFRFSYEVYGYIQIKFMNHYRFQDDGLHRTLYI